MRCVCLLFLVLFLIAADGNKDIFNMMAPIVKANLDDFLRKPYLSYQNSSIDVARLISPIAEAATDEFRKIFKSTCGPAATCLEFCRGLEVLKDFSEIGAQKLNRLLDPKVSLNITEQACSKYIDRIDEVIKTTLKKYSDRINSKKIGCYLIQIRKTIANFTEKINEIGGKNRENSQREFEKNIKNHRRDINDFIGNVQKEYLACQMGPDIEKCLDKYAESKDVKKLPSDFKGLIIQSLTSIRRKFNKAGLGMKDVEAVIDEHKDDIEAVLRKCGGTV